MPPLPPVPGVLKVALEFGDVSDLRISTRRFWSYTGGAPSAADLITLATTINGHAQDAFIPLMTSTTNLLGVKVTDIGSDIGAEGEFRQSAAGTRTGYQLPAGVAVLVNDQIARRYRGGKPRSYLPFGSSTDLDGNQRWTAGFVNAVTSAWNTFVTAMNATASGSVSLGHPVNVSFYSGFSSYQNPATGRYKSVSQVRAVPVVDAIVAASCSQIIGSQRRRYRA
jgi:hypothetical protein